MQGDNSRGSNRSTEDEEPRISIQSCQQSSNSTRRVRAPGTALSAASGLFGDHDLLTSQTSLLPRMERRTRWNLRFAND